MGLARKPVGAPGASSVAFEASVTTTSDSTTFAEHSNSSSSGRRSAVFAINFVELIARRSAAGKERSGCSPKSVLDPGLTKNMSVPMVDAHLQLSSCSPGELTEAEAREVLWKRLLLDRQRQREDEKTAAEFLDMLAFLALAIVQAVAYMNAKGVTVAKYISLFKSS